MKRKRNENGFIILTVAEWLQQIKKTTKNQKINAINEIRKFITDKNTGFCRDPTGEISLGPLYIDITNPEIPNDRLVFDKLPKDNDLTDSKKHIVGLIDIAPDPEDNDIAKMDLFCTKSGYGEAVFKYLFFDSNFNIYTKWKIESIPSARSFWVDQGFIVDTETNYDNLYPGEIQVSALTKRKKDSSLYLYVMYSFYKLYNRLLSNYLKKEEFDIDDLSEDQLNLIGKTDIKPIIDTLYDYTQSSIVTQTIEKDEDNPMVQRNFIFSSRLETYDEDELLDKILAVFYANITEEDNDMIFIRLLQSKYGKEKDIINYIKDIYWYAKFELKLNENKDYLSVWEKPRQIKEQIIGKYIYYTKKKLSNYYFFIYIGCHMDNNQSFFYYQFGVLSIKLIPSEAGKLASYEDRGILATGIFTDALRMRLEEKLNNIITSKHTLVFIQDPNNETEAVKYCIGLYHLGKTIKDYMKFFDVKIQDKYFIAVVKDIIKTYDNQRLWEVDQKVYLKNPSYWNMLRFNNGKWINSNIPLEFSNKCIQCPSNNITLMNTESGIGYCSKSCIEKRKNKIHRYVY